MLPRPVLPGENVLLTRRCTQRTFLLRPDDDTNQTYLYVLGLAAERTGVGLAIAVTMSNHEHVVAHDDAGRRVEFYQYLHELVARATNALRGQFENFWAAEQTSVVRLVEVDDLIEKIVYAATNPVAAGLVERVHHWPGVNTLRALLDKEPIVVKRPRHFFSEDMPEEVTLHFTIPPGLGDVDQILARIRARVAEVEAEHIARRAATGARVLGRRAVKAQSWRDRPTTHEPRFGLRPQVAARNRWARIEAPAAQPSLPRGLQRRAHPLAAGRAHALPTGHLLAPALRLRPRRPPVPGRDPRPRELTGPLPQSAASAPACAARHAPSRRGR